MGDRLTTIDMGRKVGADVPVSVGELMSPAPRPTSVPNDILIYPAVRPQNRDGKKWGLRCCVPFGVENWVPI